MGDIVNAARGGGAKAMAIRMRPDECAYRGNPLILHVNDNHYVALLGVEDERMVIFDNRIGLTDCTRDVFRQMYRWDGAAVVLGTPSPEMALALYGKWVGGIFAVAGAFFFGWTISSRRGRHRAQGESGRAGVPPVSPESGPANDVAKDAKASM